MVPWTPQERGVFLFIAAVWLAGIGVQWWHAQYPAHAFSRISPRIEKIDLNTASLDELAHTRGVSPRLATAIVTLRAQRGGFRSVEELTQVRGIGPVRLRKLSAIFCAGASCGDR